MINPKANIVVVDDTRENLHLLSEILSQSGYHARLILDGKQVLKAVQKKPPDLILLDIMMPDISGYEVCELLKSDESTRSIPIIFISALNEAFDKVKAFTIGGVDYITKPFQKEEMIARIESQLIIQRQKQLLINVLNHSLNGILAMQSVRNKKREIIDFQFSLVNPVAAKIIGKSADDLIGKRLLENFPGVKKERLFDEYLAVVENNIILRKELYYEHESIRGWFDLVAAKMGDGITVNFSNITSRKKMELSLERQANLDGLTGVANRHGFENYMKIEWQRCMTEQRALSLIFCDVDYFKRYNDQYGHQMGDECLIKVAQTISKAVKRANDLVARYGGEEFIVVLPATNVDGAMQTAEYIINEVQQLQITHSASQAHEFVTISVGVSSIVPTNEDTLEKLIGAADKALYQAKSNGRNRVIKNILH